MRYQIDYTEEARRALRTLPGNYRQRIKREIESLAENPYPHRAKELRDHPGIYRVWVDRWRIIYRVEDGELLILVLGVRYKTGTETYDDLETS